MGLLQVLFQQKNTPCAIQSSDIQSRDIQTSPSEAPCVSQSLFLQKAEQKDELTLAGAARLSLAALPFPVCTAQAQQSSTRASAVSGE